MANSIRRDLRDVTASYARGVWAAFLALVLHTSALAQATTEHAFEIERSEVREIHSQGLGRGYQLFIQLPPSYASTDDRIPLVLLTDGPYAFPLVASIVRRLAYGKLIEAPIIVALSYENGESGDASRMRDYTPVVSAHHARRFGPQASRYSGQGPLYQRFIRDEVLPLLRREYRVDTRREIYAGHSFGGLLGAQMLLTAPDTFDYYILGSPSIWFENHAIFRIEERARSSARRMSARVLMITGAYETPAAGRNADTRYDMVGDMFELQRRLQSWEQAHPQIVAYTLDGENHMTVFPPLITRGLLWALGGQTQPAAPARK